VPCLTEALQNTRSRSRFIATMSSILLLADTAEDKTLGVRTRVTLWTNAHEIRSPTSIVYQPSNGHATFSGGVGDRDGGMSATGLGRRCRRRRCDRSGDVSTRELCRDRWSIADNRRY